jgi:methyl-accepting chemotaxis protein
MANFSLTDSLTQGRNAGRLMADLQGSDEDRTRLLLRVLVAFLIAIGVGSLLQVVLSLVQVLPAVVLTYSLVSIVALLLVGMGVWVCSRWVSPRAATLVFLYGIVAAVLLLLALTGMANQSLLALFLVPIVAAGIFAQRRDPLWVLIVSLTGYSVLAIMFSVFQVQPALSLGATVPVLLSTITLLSVGGTLTYLASLWSEGTAQFIVQSRIQSEDLLRNTETLIQKGIQQVEVGNELSAAAAELLTASHQQARGATEQASAVSQISTTIEELGATARQIAQSSEQVADAARQTLENLSEGQAAVDNSIQAMERIRGRMRDVSARVLSLGERSQQIGEIIDLINDLSDETHLLALNAAIEAAGAGEHGRRFAVVAAEVKSLANRALAAAKEVKGVIAEVQKATNASVLAAEEGGKEVEQGVDLANRAGIMMDQIVMAAERTAQSAGEISLATAQQQSASEQVVETMREVAEVARQTAVGSRQMSESAQMLTSIAERLHGLNLDDTV